MGLLHVELGLTDTQLQKIVERAATDVMMKYHFNYGDIDSMTDSERRKHNDEFKEGLEFLSAVGIIRFTEEMILYRVTIINRYQLEQLVGELSWLETYLEGFSDKTPPPIEDMAFYERSTGNIIINGTRKTLKDTNKKLFDALFIANPESASRSTLLRIIGEKKREQSSEKIALNEAFSNLRKACGVTSKTISLRQNGGKLKARAAQLIEADEIYLSNFLTA